MKKIEYEYSITIRQLDNAHQLASLKASNALELEKLKENKRHKEEQLGQKVKSAIYMYKEEVEILKKMGVSPQEIMNRVKRPAIQVYSKTKYVLTKMEAWLKRQWNKATPTIMNIAERSRTYGEYTGDTSRPSGNSGRTPAANSHHVQCSTPAAFSRAEANDDAFKDQRERSRIHGEYTGDTSRPSGNSGRTPAANSHHVQCSTPAAFSRVEENDDTFKGMTFNDENLRKEEEKHKKNLETLNEDHERRMRALEKVRNRKLEEADLKYHQSAKRMHNDTSGFETGEYRSDFMHRGYCLIIQNSRIHEKSAELLGGYLMRCGYVVEYSKNLNETTMMTLFQSYSQRNFTNYGSLMSFVFSRGNDKDLESSDQKHIDLAKIVEIFNPDKVTTLKGKPKMFFVQNDIDILKDGSEWEKEKEMTSVFPYYPDVFLLQSTLRDFPKIFTDYLIQDNRKTLNEVLDTVKRYAMPMATDKEKYEIVSTLTKKVNFGENEATI